MYWSDQQARPVLNPVVVSTLNNLPYFTYCVQISGYRDVYDNECLCVNCYNRLRVVVIKSRYEHCVAHLAVCGMSYPHTRCAICSTWVSERRPFRDCHHCKTKFTEFLNELFIDEIPFDQLPDPVVLKISGRHH